MLRSPLPLLTTLALTGALALPAQTKSATTTTHHSTSTAAHRTAHPAAKSTCVTVPTLSPKIPALPAGTPCAKALFTIAERLDYLSPLVGPNVREGFSNLPMIFSLDYVEIEVGVGEPAKPHMWYTVQYTGYLTDGTKFDSSLDHPGKEPITFPYGGHRVIPGWDLGFEGMRVGGRRRLFIPYQLAYGERGQPGHIPPKSELVFDMQLISQSDQPPKSKTPPVAPVTPGAPGAPTSPAAPATPPTPGSLPATPPTGTAPGAPPSPAAPNTPPNPTSPTTPPPATTPPTPTTPHP